LAKPTRRLIKKVDLDLTVSDTTGASESLNKLATDLGGHIGSSSARKSDGLMFYEMTLRVPEARLGEAIAAIKKLASEVNREVVGAEDVTDQYVDLEARLKTLEATETELRALLSESRQRQQKAEDIMAIYRELTGIRSNIEQIRGQLNVLENMTSLATIHVTLSPIQSPATVVTSWRPVETVRNSFQALATTLTVLVDFAIVFVIVVIPTVLLIGSAVWLGFKLWQAARGRRRVNASS
jgi:hypothetical protein